MKRTERTIELYKLGESPYLSVEWRCPECDTLIGVDVKRLDNRATCACGYQWMVEIRPRFYVVRD